MELEHKELKSPVGKKTAEIWAAYQELLAEVKGKPSAPPSTAAVAQQKKVEAAVKTANSIGDLSGILAELDRFTKALTTAKGTYDEISIAIAAKKEELAAVHGLEAEANAAVALVAAKDKLVAEKTALADKIVSEAQEKATEIVVKAREEATILRDESQRADDLAERDRQRRQEEWEYNFGRQQTERLDEATDEINKRMKAVNEAELAVEAREAKAGELDTQIKILQEKLAAADTVTKVAVADAIAKTEAHAKKAAETQKTIIDSAHNAKLVVAEADNKALREQLTEAKARILVLETQVMNANEKVTQIATDAVKAGAEAKTVAKVAEVAAGAGGGRK